MDERSAGQMPGLEQEAALSDSLHGIVAEVAQAEATASVVEADAAHCGAAAVAAEQALADLDRRIRELEAAIGDLRTVAASGSNAPAGRKTQPSYSAQLLSKGAEQGRGGTVDAALGGLSPEQRIAVKAGLLRAGLL